MYRIQASGPLPVGYLNADYFLENVLSMEFATRVEAANMARATYLGPDRFGDGPNWEVIETR
jgi:hypothetical protein